MQYGKIILSWKSCRGVPTELGFAFSHPALQAALCEQTFKDTAAPALSEESTACHGAARLTGQLHRQQSRKAQHVELQLPQGQRHFQMEISGEFFTTKFLVEN